MAAARARVLVVDDAQNMRSLLQAILSPTYDVIVAPDGNIALFNLERTPFDLVLTDVRMPGPDGLELTRLIKKKWPLTEVVLMTAFASIPSAVEAVRVGAYDYIAKPFDPDDVALVIARALERRRDRARINDVLTAREQLVTFSYREALADARDRGSREYLAALLETFDGNVSRAAERAGLERESLHRLLRRYGIQADAFRGSDARPALSSSRDTDS
jgi:DNA-binding NtrC family response regulator